MTSQILQSKPEYKHSNFWLSVSKAKTFKDCPAKYRFSYILKLPKKDYDFQVFGKLLHEILERFHKHLLKNSVDFEQYQKLLSDCLHAAQFEEKDKISWKSKITSEQIAECQVILDQYLKILEKEKDQPKSIILDLEKSFYVMIDDVIVLNGFIDLLKIDPDGVLHVADYKTSKSDSFLKKDYFQLLVYAFVCFLEDEDLQKIRCSYILLRKNFKMITKEYTREEVMNEIEPKLIEIYQEIKNEKLFLPQPNPLCNFCDYLDSCPEGTEFSKNKKSSFKPKFENKVKLMSSW